MTRKQSDGNSIRSLSSLYDFLSHEAPEGVGIGETRTTKAVETVDEAPTEHHDTFAS